MATPVAATPDVKPGWRTTEFWMAVGAQVIGLLFASGLICTGHDTELQKQACQIAGLAAMALTHAGYAVSRGLAKGGSS